MLNNAAHFPISFAGPDIPEGFFWFNQPARYCLNGALEMVTDPETDFWQRTHYNFQKDDGHALFTSISGDFSMKAQVRFEPRAQYNQCGLMVRADAEHWIKISTEYENTEWSRLGSVVTNAGYSDWATQDIPSSSRECWYRVSRHGNDFLIEHSHDGDDWRQMRIAHLHFAPESLWAGPYACSPVGATFLCRFLALEIGSVRAS